MKIQMQKKALESIVKEAMKFYNTKTKARFLKMLWFNVEAENAYIQLTDANIEYQAKIHAEIFEPGIAGIDAKNFQKLLKSLSDETIILSSEGENITIKQGKRHFEIEGADASWFAEYEALPTEFVEMSDLKKVFDKIEPFCRKDTDDMTIDKINIVSKENSLQIMATNNHIFSFVELPQPGLFPETVQLFGSHAAKLKKWLTNKPTKISFSDTRIYFARYGEVVSLPFYSDNWLDYPAFFDRFNNDVSELTVDRKALLSSLEILCTFCTPEEQAISLQPDSDQVEISHKNNASEILEAEYFGNIEKILFPCKDFLAVIKQFSNDTITLEFTENNGPCRIAENNHSMLIMPVEIEEPVYEEETYAV